MRRYKKYEAVAISEEAIKKAKEWAADKSGLNNIKSAGRMTKKTREYEDSAISNANLGDKEAKSARIEFRDSDAHYNSGDLEKENEHLSKSIGHYSDAVRYYNKASYDKHRADENRDRQKKLRASGTRQMENFGANTGSIGGAALGAAAGKGYSVYKRHQMKKRGATKKELAEHKKGDASRMLAGAAIGGLIGGKGGRAIGGKVANKVYKSAGGED